MWMRVDDGLHAHRKTRAATRHTDKRRDVAPMGLWVLAGSWSGRNNQAGWVPCDELDRFDDDWEALANRLVAAGFWWPEDRDGEPGYGFNDWGEWNNPTGPSASGTFGNHKRWHVDKGIVKEDCDLCPKEPDDLAEEPPDEPDHRPDSGATSPRPSPRVAPDIGSDIAPDSHPTSLRDHRPDSLTRPDPSLTRPEPKSVVSAAKPHDAAQTALVLAEAPRPDVDRICDHLAARIADNGSKRPTVTAKWRDSARLMLDRDGHSEDDVHAAIDWSQADEFWRGNVLSLPKLREKYDQLRLQASRSPRSASGDRNQQQRDLLARALERAEAKERNGA